MPRGIPCRVGYHAAWDTRPHGTEDCGPAEADWQYVAAGGQDMHGLAHSIYAEMFTPELKATFEKIETLDMTVCTHSSACATQLCALWSAHSCVR